MSTWRICSVFSAVCLSACVGGGDGATASAAAGPRATFDPTGFLAGDVSSQASAVSADGLVVVGNSQSVSGKAQAFRWTRLDAMKGLGLLASGSFSKAHAVSADGSIVVGEGDSQAAASTVFRWNQVNGMVALKALANSTLCVGAGVSGDGNVVIGTCLTTGSTAFRWTENSGMMALTQFGGGSNRSSSALAISGDATAVVGAGHPVLTGAVVWNLAGEAILLGALPGDVSAAATSVSRDGGVVTGFSTDANSHQRVFRWVPGYGMSILGTGAQVFSDLVPSAVSGDGKVIVGWGNSADAEHAWIWDEVYGMRLIKDLLRTDYQTEIAGWALSRATGISDDGRTVVGFGINPTGHTEGWVLKFQK